MARVTWRLLPFLLLLYIVSWLDRVNVGFAKLQMADQLGISDAVYGFGAGVFFIGYFLFEVPSNLILARVGARRWLPPLSCPSPNGSNRRAACAGCRTPHRRRRRLRHSCRRTS